MDKKQVIMLGGSLTRYSPYNHHQSTSTKSSGGNGQSGGNVLQPLWTKSLKGGRTLKRKGKQIVKNVKRRRIQDIFG